MNKSVLSLALCTLALAGCAVLSPVPTLEVRSNPQVTARDGRIALSQEILYFRSDEKNVTVTWRLPPDTKLRFPANGIVIEGAIVDRVVRGTGNRAEAVALDPNQTEIVDCRAAKDGLEFTCLNRNTKPGVYKYTIRVRDGDRLLERDPGVVNGNW
jgi:hypothetical protein